MGYNPGMELLGASILVRPAEWPAVLTTAAAGLLVLEAVVLLRRQIARRGAPAGVLLGAAALVGGPVVAAVGLFVGVLTASTALKGERFGPRGRSLFHVGAWGTLLGGLTLLLLRYPDAGAILVLGLLGLFWAVRAYHKTTSPLSRRARRMLLALRWAAIALLTLAALRPTMHYTTVQTETGLLLVGLDHSGSMDRPDMNAAWRDGAALPGRPTSRRIQAVVAALRDMEPYFEDVQNQGTEVRAFSFSEGLFFSPMPLETTSWRELLSPPSGKATSLGDSLQEAVGPLLESTRGLRGVILFTDGVHNVASAVEPETLAARLGARGVPIHTVGVGSNEVSAETKSITVRSIGAPPQAEIYQKLTIQPVVETMGLKGNVLRVTAKMGEQELPPQTRRLERDRSSEAFEFSFRPDQTGFTRIVVTATLDAPPPDLSGRQTLDALVHVVDRDIRILYLDGTFRYETKFIAQALAGAERIKLHRVILLRPGQGPGNALEDWLPYHGILLGDVSAKLFTAEQLNCMRAMIEQEGRGLAMIGGMDNFGRGGWGQTPLADLLPVDVAQSVGQIDEPVTITPTDAGRESKLLDLGEDWSLLDALPGANHLRGVKPTATVLAEDQNGRPMVVRMEHGKGRSLAIAFDTSWRWVLTPNEVDTAAMQRRFWRQVAIDLADPKGAAWIRADRTEYDLDRLKNGRQEIHVTAGVEDSQGKPLPDAPMSVTLTDPDGRTETIRLGREDRGRRGILPVPRGTGEYRLDITAEADGKTLHNSYTFAVRQRDLESGAVLANFDLLQRMSREGHGRFVPLANLEALLDDLRAAAAPRRIEYARYHDLTAGRNAWAIFLVLLALLCAEWILRKRRNLV